MDGWTYVERWVGRVEGSPIKVWIDEGYGYGGMTVASKRALLAEMLGVEGSIVKVV
jgi:hypothetical protein